MSDTEAARDEIEKLLITIECHAHVIERPMQDEPIADIAKCIKINVDELRAKIKSLGWLSPDQLAIRDAETTRRALTRTQSSTDTQQQT